MGEGMTLLGAQRIIELENEVAVLRKQLESRAEECAFGDEVGESVATFAVLNDARPTDRSQRRRPVLRHPLERSCASVV